MLKIPEFLAAIDNPEELLLDSIGTPVVIDDVTLVVERLGELRASGVTSIQDAIEGDPRLIESLLSGIQPVWFNELAVRLFEADSMTELLSRVSEIILPESIPTLVGYLQSLQYCDSGYISDSPMQTLSGNRIHIRLNCGIIKHDEKTYTINTLTDITDWQNTRKSLTALQTRYSLALKGTELGVWDYDIRRDKMERNAEYYRILGYSEDELNHSIRSVQSIMHPDDLHDVKELLCADGDVDMQFRVRRRDGSGYRWMHSKGSVCQRDQFGQCIRAVGTIRDVTSQRRGQELTDLEKQIYESAAIEEPIEHLLATVARQVDLAYPEFRSAVLVLDETRQFVEHAVAPSIPNEFTAALTHFPIMKEHSPCRSAMRSGTLEIAELLTENEEFATMASLCSPLGIRAACSMPLMDSTRKALGTICVTSTQPMLDPLADIAGLDRVARSLALILERRRRHLQDERRALREQTLNKFESLGKLAGGVAHDFNNLLSVIMMNVELCEMNVDSDAAVAENLKHAKEAAVMAASLCKQMLTFAGQRPTTRHHVDLADETQKVAAILDPAPNRIEVHVDPETPTIMGDRAGLSQVILNLLTNAIEASGDDGVVDVTIGSKTIERRDLDTLAFAAKLQPGPCLCLSVEDQGVGMTEETQRRIFEPFFTTKAEGHGLGLATVLGIVEQQRGAIDVQSKLGIGTRFQVFLPLDDSDSIE